MVNENLISYLFKSLMLAMVDNVFIKNLKNKKEKSPSFGLKKDSNL